jgi:diacylglycerol kinase
MLDNDFTSERSSGPQLHVDPPGGRRPAWRQRLVQAERGLVRSVRSDSAFFVHFFGATIITAAAVVLGLSSAQWIALVSCVTVVLTAEMFNTALKILIRGLGMDEEAEGQRALGAGTAAVLIAVCGSGIVIGLVFLQRLGNLFGI